MRWVRFFVIYLCLLPSAAFSAFGIFQVNGGTASAPVVASASFTVSSPVSNGGAVGTPAITCGGGSCSGGNALTGCSITAGDAPGNFQVNSSCVITTTANGVSNITADKFTASLTIQASNTAGNGSNTASVAAYADGFVSAPNCTTQLPTALTGYSTRPPWKAAGVDYCVGIDNSVTLQDPVPAGSLAAALVAQGGSFNNASHFIQFSGSSPVTINGWDFSLHGGIGIVISVTATSVVVENSKFNVSTNGRAPIITNGTTATNITITNCVIDGNKVSYSPAGGLIALTASGTILVEYNYILNTYDQHMQISVDSGASNALVLYSAKHNLLLNVGWGSQFGAHGDMMQVFSANGGTPTFDDVEVNFNTFVQNDASNTDQLASQGVTYGTGGGTATYLLENTSYNSFIFPVPGTGTINVNTAIIVDSGFLNGTSNIFSNYIDPNAITNHWYRDSKTTGPFSGTVNIGTGANNNFNMTNGVACGVSGTSGTNCP